MPDYVPTSFRVQALARIQKVARPVLGAVLVAVPQLLSPSLSSAVDAPTVAAPTPEAVKKELGPPPKDFGLVQNDYYADAQKESIVTLVQPYTCMFILPHFSPSLMSVVYWVHPSIHLLNIDCESHALCSAAGEGQSCNIRHRLEDQGRDDGLRVVLPTVRRHQRQAVFLPAVHLHQRARRPLHQVNRTALHEGTGLVCSRQLPYSTFHRPLCHACTYSYGVKIPVPEKRRKRLLQVRESVVCVCLSSSACLLARDLVLIHSFCRSSTT